MITKKEVERIARLAHIDLTEGEKGKFEKDFEGILEFVSHLEEADTAGVEPVAGGLATKEPKTLVEETRSDEAALPYDNPAELVNAAPRKKEGWVEVEAVF